jgi:CO dehydrogenase maturation factor
LLEALVAHILLRRDEVVMMDMEAGIEHFGRATAKAVDELIVVVEPGKASVETAFRIRELAKDIGLANVKVVANKVRTDRDKDYLVAAMPDFEFLGFIPYDQTIIEAGLGNFPLSNASSVVIDQVKDIAARLGAVKSETIGKSAN